MTKQKSKLTNKYIVLIYGSIGKKRGYRIVRTYNHKLAIHPDQDILISLKAFEINGKEQLDKGCPYSTYIARLTRPQLVEILLNENDAERLYFKILYEEYPFDKWHIIDNEYAMERLKNKCQ